MRDTEESLGLRERGIRLREASSVTTDSSVRLPTGYVPAEVTFSPICMQEAGYGDIPSHLFAGSGRWQGYHENQRHLHALAIRSY